MKPYRLDEKKATKPILTDVDISQWREVILTNIRAEADWLPLMNLTWGDKKSTNRNLAGDDAVANAAKLEGMITFVATFSPASLFREITQRSTSLAVIWDTIRKWAGIRPSSSKHLTYAKMKKSFNPSGNQTYNEFYYALKDAKEDCLMESGSDIAFKGKKPAADEELSPCLESDIVSDWIEAIGGMPLLEHVFRVHSKDLEAVTLADLQERIAANLDTLLVEAETAVDPQTGIQRTFVNPGGRFPKKREPSSFYKNKDNYTRNPKNDSTKNFRDTRTQGASPGTSSSKETKSCALCKAKGRPQAKTHSIAECWSLTQEDRRSISQIQQIFVDDDSAEDSTSEEEVKEEN